MIKDVRNVRKEAEMMMSTQQMNLCRKIFFSVKGYNGIKTTCWQLSAKYL